MLESIIEDDWMGKDSKLVLLGGIMINVDGAKPVDLFLPLDFQVTTKEGKKMSAP